MNKEGVKKLAQLSRLQLTDAEIEKYTSEISDILTYVDSLKNATANSDDVIENSFNRNVTRADVAVLGNAQQSLIDSAPFSENNYIKVKNIL